jgi:hypothetical protein
VHFRSTKRCHAGRQAAAVPTYITVSNSGLNITLSVGCLPTHERHTQCVHAPSLAVPTSVSWHCIVLRPLPRSQSNSCSANLRYCQSLWSQQAPDGPPRSKCKGAGVAAASSINSSWSRLHNSTLFKKEIGQKNLHQKDKIYLFFLLPSPGLCPPLLRFIREAEWRSQRMVCCLCYAQAWLRLLLSGFARATALTPRSPCCLRPNASPLQKY